MRWLEMSYRQYVNRSNRARLKYENEKELYYKDKNVTRLKEDYDIYETENYKIEHELEKLGVCNFEQVWS